MGQRRRALLLGTACYLAVGLIAPRLAVAEVATDGTMGRRVSLRGGNIEIGADLGQQRGGNLFHSFRKFDVETRGRVAFTGPDSVKNVIGRVTGGEPSSIDGTLASTIPDADLYLINPAGILFGPNARLDVKGSFHASTADELRLADGAVFSALDASGSMLTVAEPQAFGFLGATTRGITLDGGVLTVLAEKAVSLTTGEIALRSGSITAPSGQVGLVAATGPGEVEVASMMPTGGEAGPISLRGRALVEVSGDGGGEVALRGSEITLAEGATLRADNTGDTDLAGGITVAADLLRIAGETSRIAADATRAGRAGTVVVSAARVEISENGQIGSSALGRGDAGRITLSADDLVLRSGGFIVGDMRAAGNAVTIEIMAQRVLLDDSESAAPSGIRSRAMDGSTGNAGSITITAHELLDIGNAGLISSSTLGTGEGGQVRIAAADVAVAPGGLIASRAERAAGSTGDAGGVTVDVRNLVLGGEVTAESQSGALGAAGYVAITASEALTVVGGEIANNTRSPRGAGAITVSAGALELRDGGLIRSSTAGDGDAGTILISARSLHVEGDSAQTGIAARANGGRGNAGNITIAAGDIELRGEDAFISSATLANGAAGNVEISADRLTVSAGASIGSRADTGSRGDAGNISLNVGSLDLTGATITSLSEAGARGAAGNISISASGRVRVSAGGEISNNSRSARGAGDLTVSAGSLVLEEDALIRSATAGNGNAGTISVSAQSVQIEGHTRQTGISARANAGMGDAGRITIAADNVELRGETSFISSATLAGGAGGAVEVRADRVSLQEGARIASQAAAEPGDNAPSTGDAGAVTIIAQDLELGDGGRVTVSTQGQGDGGQVVVDAERIKIDGEIVRSGRTIASGILAAAEAGSTGTAGAVTVRGDEISVGAGGAISGRSDSTGTGGELAVTARRSITVAGGRIETNSSAGGAAGDVLVQAPVVAVSEAGLIGSAGSGTGAAGNVRILGGRLEVEDASIRTDGQGAQGGRITVDNRERIYLRRAEVTSSGIMPESGASVISLTAPQIVLNASTVTSLTGDGQPLAGSGEASLLGDVTIISADSLVAGSSSVVISGLQTNLGSDLQLAPGTFLDASRLLRDSCAATGAGPRSSFTRGGRGGLPPAPDRPLPSAGAEASAARLGGSGWHLPVTLADCDSGAQPAPNS